MTDRFKEALDVFNRLIPSLEHSLETRLRDFHNNEPIDEMLSCVREALTIATEAEQLRKERDELARLVRQLVIEGCWDDESWIFARKVSAENGNA